MPCGGHVVDLSRAHGPLARRIGSPHARRTGYQRNSEQLETPSRSSAGTVYIVPGDDCFAKRANLFPDDAPFAYLLLGLRNHGSL
jgi:hypothetical protein